MKTGVRIVCLVGVLASCVPVAAADRPVRGADVVARFGTAFEAPPKKVWGARAGGSRATDAPLLGNGDLGVCIAGNPDKQMFWFTKNDWWRPNNGNAAPMSFGTLNIEIPALAEAEYSVRQSLVDAETVASFTGTNSTVAQTSFVAAGANVFVVALTCEGEPVEVTVSLTPHQAGGVKEHTITTGEVDGCHWATRTLAGLTMPMAATAAWRVEGAAAPTFQLAPGKTVRVLLSMVTHFDARDHGADRRCRAQRQDCQ